MSSGKPLVDVSVIIYNYVCVAQPQEPCMKSPQFAPPEETHPSIWFSASEWLMQVPYSGNVFAYMVRDAFDQGVLNPLRRVESFQRHQNKESF